MCHVRDRFFLLKNKPYAHNYVVFSSLFLIEPKNKVHLVTCFIAVCLSQRNKTKIVTLFCQILETRKILTYIENLWHNLNVMAFESNKTIMSTTTEWLFWNFQCNIMTMKCENYMFELDFIMMFCRWLTIIIFGVWCGTDEWSAFCFQMSGEK